MPEEANHEPHVRPNRLGDLRRAKKLKQSQLATLLGMSPALVNRHEHGTRTLDARSIVRYSAFYGVEPYELFVGKPVDET